MSNKIPFTPIQGTESKISSIPRTQGNLYFSTDTKKIYLDTAYERLSMGGNTGIFYGDVDFGNFQGPEFEFIIETDLEGNNEPNVNDLIINTDGCFYKVIRKTVERLVTKRIVLSGSTVGPGGEKKGEIDVEVKNGYNRTVLTGSDFTIDFLFTACNAKGEGTGAGTYEIAVNNVVKKTGVAKNAMSQDGTIDEKIINPISVGDLFNLAGDYEIRVFCYGFTGGSEKTSFSTPIINVKVTDFTVTWDLSETTIHSVDEDFSTSWNINVEGENIISSIKIDDTYTINDLTDGNLIISKDLFESHYGLTHGVHKFELSVTADIGADTVPAKTITKNLIFYDEEDSSYIIVCNFFEKEIMQYDTVQIPIMIYHGTNTENGNGYVKFKVNGVLKSTEDNMKNFEIRTFSFTPLEQGFVPISFESNNSASTTLFLNVQPLNINATETDGYELRFKASEFANNEEIKNWKLDDGQHLIFSDNFDWINGGLTVGGNDEENNYGSYFKIPAGSKLTIPYQLFLNNLNNTGASCKIIFKANNCRDYDANILKCYDSVNDKGLILNAQNGTVKYVGGELNVQYCEDTYIEYEFNIGSFSDNDTKNKYLTIWLDGTPAVVKRLSSTDQFDQKIPQYIEIGSEDCDVCLYLIKFYKKRLTKKQLLDNFIIDVPKASEIKARYDRNSIISKDSQGNEYIDPFLLAEKNPNCNVYVYSIPYMPTSKDDVKVGEDDECCTFEHYKGSKNAIRAYDKVKVRAQGTSSMAYGVSAYNLDSTFPEKWAMDDTAIPINYYNTKVNVASCEGANNALNQEWYNRFQPYKTQKRLQERLDGAVARDTMQFKNGVLFIKDNNQETSSSTATKNNVFKEIFGYAANPYPRMYSIANMGNAKKNTDVFHGAGNKYECCVEVADNNTDGQRMVTIGGFVPENKILGIQEHEVPIIFNDDLFDDDGFIKPGVDWGKSYDEYTGEERENKDLWLNALINEGLFEFRYIVKDKDFNKKPIEGFSSYDEYQEELSNRFLRLVRWFAKWNPANTYSEKDLRENLKTLLYNSAKTNKFNSYEYQIQLKNLFNEQVKLSFTEVFTEEIINKLNADVESGILERYPDIDTSTIQYNNLIIENMYDLIQEIILSNNLNISSIENETKEEIEEIIHSDIIQEWREVISNTTAPEEEVKELYKDHIYNTKYKLPQPVKFTANDLKIPSITTFYPNYNPEDEVLAGQYEPSLVPEIAYELDSKEYRAAKMLSEAGKYLIMDSVVYHYLFIERHTMVDNVAKNTFWSTEDGIHWELTKDYDNDTADGVDNSGFLTFNYGTEVMDNTENGTAIFNARTSAWLNFISLLPNLREIMYQKTSTAWKAEEYLKMFEEWQNAIPEVCWIEDVYRKYFRPYEIYGDSSYFPRLANGKKTHQRKQYEIYQQQYMDSYYKQNMKDGDYLDVRAQQPEVPGQTKYRIDATLKTYADGYITANIAGNIIHERAKKGIPVKISKEQQTAFDNATVYIYSPNLFTEFTGIENLYPQYIKVSVGGKLRKVSFNATSADQKNTFDVTADSTFPENLEELYMINCENLNSNLDLTNQKRLKILNTTGSSFTGYTIAPGAPLRTFIIEKPESINMSNLFYLNPDNVSIRNYNRLSSIELNNIDFNVNSNISKNISKNIISNAGGVLFTYKLNNIGWDFIEPSEITADGKINLLEKLLTQRVFENTSRANSLTGFGNVLESSYNNSNSINIYNRYNLVTSNDRSFPNFTLDFKGNNAKLYTINIENGDGEIVWSRKVSSLSDLENTLLTNSQKGAFNATTAVLKSESNTHIYNFANAWEFKTLAEQGEITISDGPGDYNYLDLSLIKNQLTNFNSDITIKPKYTSDIRYYRVSFFGEDQENPFYVKTDATFGQTFNEVKPITIPSKDDGDLALEITYQFVGYSSDPRSSSIINENAWSVTVDNIMMYAVFAEKSVYDISDEVYSSYLNITGNNVYGLLLNQDSQPVYSGKKIVIPANITKIKYAAFQDNKTLRHIFVRNNSNLQEIEAYAFKNSSIEYFEFARPLQTIGTDAFYLCPFILRLYDNDFALPSSLTTLNGGAFNGCGSSSENNPNMVNIRVPSGITTMGDRSIANWNTQHVTVYIGTPEQKTNIKFTNTSTVRSNRKPAGAIVGQNKDIYTVVLYSNVYNSYTDYASETLKFPLWKSGGAQDEVIFYVPNSVSVNPDQNGG